MTFRSILIDIDDTLLDFGKAEKAAMMNAVYGMIPRIGSMISGYCTSRNRLNNMALGATPNVTTSAKESNSLPMGEDTPNALATIPSKKSKMAPKRMNTIAQK